MEKINVDQVGVDLVPECRRTGTIAEATREFVRVLKQYRLAELDQDPKQIAGVFNIS